MATKFLLDSGDPNEYREIALLAKQKSSQLWGSTTNPSLIAKKLAGQKVSAQEAFSVLQKQIITEILGIVPGAVSGEVYASSQTLSDQMITQGKEIATWGDRVVVKLPTTIEGFKARTELRKLGICINNTLVFSQQQVFAITLHEKIMISLYGKPKSSWPCFISPFVGRLDDIGQDGLSMVSHSLNMVRKSFAPDTAWMLEASVRSVAHLKKGIDLGCELITAPANIFADWFALTPEQQSAIDTKNSALTEIPNWSPTDELLQINSVESFMDAITTKKLDIAHDLTDKGIDKFVADWSQIITA